mmetsp:Transcript_9469/g.14263  ORF Transcript_9469/g.14263 Transcript_9469/m.14263 type:complete len:426 (-) Transcript_9469:229-1506(-)
MEVINDINQLQSFDGNKSEAITALELFLHKIQSFPLSMDEKIKIECVINDFMCRYDITKRDYVYKLCIDRLSFTYLPGISTLDIKTTENTHKNQSPQKGVNTTTPMYKTMGSSESFECHTDDCMAAPTMTDAERLRVALLAAPRGAIMECTIQRKKTALWTTYRLFVDDIRSSRPRSASSGGLDHTAAENNSTRGSGGKDDLLSPGFLLCARKPMSGLSSQYHLWTSRDSRDWREKSAIGRVTRSNGTYVARLHESSTVVGPEQAYVHVAVMSGGLDKLIHIAAAASVAHDGENMETAAVEELLVSTLECITSRQSPESSPSNVLALRSRQPRKSNVITGQEGDRQVYTMSFGGGRVRNPSRKNIVIDRVEPTAQDPQGNDWTLSVVNGPPVFQLGKMDEDLFSLDFTDLSPFQAFCIALTAFDQ